MSETIAHQTFPKKWYHRIVKPRELQKVGSEVQFYNGTENLVYTVTKIDKPVKKGNFETYSLHLALLTRQGEKR